MQDYWSQIFRVSLDGGLCRNLGPPELTVLTEKYKLGILEEIVG